MKVGTFFTSYNFLNNPDPKSPVPWKIVFVEFEATKTQFEATSGRALENMINNSWKRLAEVAGPPPLGWSSWLDGRKFYKVPK